MSVHQYNQPIYNPIIYIYNPINQFLYINNHEISRLSRKYEDQSLKYKHFRFCNKSTLTLCLCNALSKLYMKKILNFSEFLPRQSGVSYLLASEKKWYLTIIQCCMFQVLSVIKFSNFFSQKNRFFQGSILVPEIFQHFDIKPNECN